MRDAVPEQQPLQVQPLHAGHDPGVLQRRQMQNQRLYAPLDLRRQLMDALLAALLIALQEIRCPERLPEVHQHIAAVDLLR